MTEEKIRKNNKLIAEFMGCIKEDRFCGVEGHQHQWKVWRFKDSAFHNTIGDFKIDTPYHDTWNWLMTVVEKIENMENNNFSVNICKTKCFIDAILENITCKNTGNKLESTYLAVIEFIKWYNENRQI
jgi:hypothetical protein